MVVLNDSLTKYFVPKYIKCYKAIKYLISNRTFIIDCFRMLVIYEVADCNVAFDQCNSPKHRA